MYNLSEKIQRVVDSSHESFEIAKGLTFNHRDTINNIYYYKNDTFMACSDEKAIFWNVVKPYIMHYAKNIDLDPKDFRGTGEGDANYFQSWILNLKFQKWADETNLSIKIDDLTQLVSEFGSYVWKLTTNKKGEKDIEPCDLRHLYFDHSVSNIQDTNIVEKHYLTDAEIRSKSDFWDNTEEIIKMSYTGDDNLKTEFDKKEIWEYTGWVEDGKKRAYVHAIGSGYGENCIIAFEEEIEKEECKYFDFHLDKYSGRWLRKGAYETNFILQERANTVVNENADASTIASLLILRSQDPNTRGNALRGMVSGQIVTSSDLQQVGIDNRAAGVLLNELDRIEAQVRKNLMLPDVATGDQLPSGTTFRGQVLMSNAYKSAFKQTRNRIAEPLKDIVQEYILPSLVDNWNKDELLELSGDERGIDLYDNAIKTKRKIEYLIAKNELSSPLESGELEALDADTSQQIKTIGRRIEHGKKFFNFKYGFSIDPTGETFDKAQQNDALIQAITLTAQNPAISDIPAFRQLLENNGITAFNLSPDEKKGLMNMGDKHPMAMNNMAGSLSGVVDTGNQ